METVQLLVYDLSRGLAISLSQQILGQRIEGIWHTGVLFMNTEYYYGGGIQTAPNGVFASQNQLFPSQTLTIGQTNKTKQDLNNFLISIHPRFSASTYDLIRNNCNHFANEVCIFLTGNSIPSYIVDLPNIIFSTPGGAMLRPMIENMQRSAYAASEHTFDPFSNTAASSTANSNNANIISNVEFETILSNSIRSAILESDKIVKVKLDEYPSVSNDTTSLKVLGNKILQLSRPDSIEKGNLLSEDEKQLISSIISVLQQNKAIDDLDNRFNAKLFELLQKLVEDNPQSQMAVLFVLRLIALNEQVIKLNEIKTIDWILNKVSTDLNYLNSVPALTMAICLLSNLISHNAGIDYIIQSHNNSSDSDRANKIVDISMSGLSHSRVEVRQMSIALAYNYTLLNTQDFKLSKLWLTATNSEETRTKELHTHAVQLLLGCMDNLNNEQDINVRKRCLSVICRITRTYGVIANNFGKEIGFINTLSSLKDKLKSENHDNPFEYDLITELSVAFA